MIELSLCYFEIVKTTDLFTGYSQPPWLEPRAAYVHIPFCGHHCGYCDFAVTAGQDHLIELYLDALDTELSWLRTPRFVETIFIGGGTPSYLHPDQLKRLLSSIKHWLPTCLPVANEYSIESTPESLTEDKVRILREYGVTRVSVGVQSFQNQTLRALDRKHGVEQIFEAVAAVRQYIPELSLDLIFAAPGQTLSDWQHDLETAIRFEPDHISTYGLTYEKGTPMWKERHHGRISGVAEDVELEMYRYAIERLAAAGFEHYEISNFARPGKRSQHNAHYWANEAYYGFGVGAARYVRGVRELNTRDTQLYIRKMLSGESPTFQSEQLKPRERAFETIGTQLRRCEGIHRLPFQQQTAFQLDALIGERLKTLIEGGLLQDTGDAIALTLAGKCVADGIIEDLMKAQ